MMRALLPLLSVRDNDCRLPDDCEPLPASGSIAQKKKKRSFDRASDLFYPVRRLHNRIIFYLLPVKMSYTDDLSTASKRTRSGF
jgi:hypothetical protein